MTLQAVLIVSAAIIAVSAFGRTLPPFSIAEPLRKIQASTVRRSQMLQLRVSESNNEDNSRNLLSLLTIDEGEKDEDKIKGEISSLESTFDTIEDNSNKRFDPLIGLYEVKSVLSKNKNDNPVGGKWTRKNGLAQKLFQTRAMFQHLLPLNVTGLCLSSEAVAEAVNVVSLDALGGLWRITVILRGDAVPLSSDELTQMNTNRTITPLTNLAVRAYFDPPRIFFGKRNKKKKGSDSREYSYLPLQIGPKSSVVLDTTYYDKAVRVGMGGTSGTRFVFTSTDVEEAKEYEALLNQPAGNTKMKALTRLGGILVASLYVASGRSAVGAVNKLGLLASKLANIVANAKATAIALNAIQSMGVWAKPALRIMAGLASLASGGIMLLLLFSSGGIERDEIAMPGTPTLSP